MDRYKQEFCGAEVNSTIFPKSNYLDDSLISNFKENETWINTIGCVVMILSLLFQLYLMYESEMKIRYLKSPKAGPSYCVLTILILKLLQLCLGLSIFLQIIRIVFVCMGNSFNDSADWLKKVYQVVLWISYYTFDALFVA